MMHVFVIEPKTHLSNLLKHQNDVDVMGSAVSTGEAAKRPIFQSKASKDEPDPDFIILSAGLPAPEVTRFLVEHRQDGPPMVMADIAENDSAILAFLEAGAAGYVPKGTTGRQMVSILSDVAAGKPPLAPTIGTALVGRMHELLALQQQRLDETLLENCPDLTTLTVREREILMLIRAGASNQAIASELMIELGTVKNHVHNILKKLNVTRREQAASYVDLLEQIEA